MNEEKVEDMKAQYAIRHSRILTPAKANLRVVEPSQAQSIFVKARLTLSALWARISKPTADLDSESWRRIEYRNEYQDPRDSRHIDLQRWF